MYHIAVHIVLCMNQGLGFFRVLGANKAVGAHCTPTYLSPSNNNNYIPLERVSNCCR